MPFSKPILKCSYKNVCTIGCRSILGLLCRPRSNTQDSRSYCLQLSMIEVSRPTLLVTVG